MASSLSRLFCTAISATKQAATSSITELVKQTTASSPTTDLVLKQAGSNPIRDISNSLFKERNLTKLVERFIKSSDTHPRFRCKHRIYQVTVRRLAAAKRFSSIEQILEKQKTYPDIAREGFAMRIINLYGRAGMFDHASKTFEEMPELKCDRTVKSFNALLNAGVDSNKYDEVEKLFRELPESLKVTPDHFSYNIMIRGYCEMGNLDSALNMLDEMEKVGLKPSLITFNTLLYAFFEEADRFEDGLKLWKRMEESGIVPCIRSFNSKLRGLANVGKTSEAVELFEEIKKIRGMEPDAFSYTALIRGYCNDGELEEAKRLYMEMVTYEIAPVRSTVETLVPRLCEDGDFKLALRVCRDSIKRDCYVVERLLQLVIDGLVKDSMVEEAKGLAELAWAKSYSRKTLVLPSEDTGAATASAAEAAE